MDRNPEEHVNRQARAFCHTIDRQSRQARAFCHIIDRQSRQARAFCHITDRQSRQARAFCHIIDRQVQVLDRQRRLIGPGNYWWDVVTALDGCGDAIGRNAAIERLAHRFAKNWRLFDPSLRGELAEHSAREGASQTEIKQRALMVGIYLALIDRNEVQSIQLEDGVRRMRPMDLPSSRHPRWLNTKALGHAKAWLRDDQYPKQKGRGNPLAGAWTDLEVLQQHGGSEQTENLVEERSLFEALHAHASRRERELLELLHAGLQPAEAADAMGVKRATVDVLNHRLRKKAANL